MQLHEKYAPKSWDEYVGQDRAKSIARRIIARKGFDRAAFWIDCAGDNNSGTGKTTLSRLIADEVADPMNVHEVGGSEVNIEWCRAMADAVQYIPMGSKPCRVYVINEAHAMTEKAVDWFLAFMDRMPANLVLIFTTTRKPDEGIFGADEGPMYSRCTRLTLTNQGLAKSFGKRLHQIAVAEDLDGGKTEEWFVRLVQRFKNNFRAALNAVASFAAMADVSESDTDSAAA